MTWGSPVLGPDGTSPPCPTPSAWVPPREPRCRSSTSWSGTSSAGDRRGRRPAGRDGRTKLVDWPELLPRREHYRKQGRTVVWTNGCFDILHVGHVERLRPRDVIGDVLVVGVNDDACTSGSREGPGPPVHAGLGAHRDPERARGRRPRGRLRRGRRPPRSRGAAPRRPLQGRRLRAAERSLSRAAEVVRLRRPIRVPAARRRPSHDAIWRGDSQAAGAASERAASSSIATARVIEDVGYPREPERISAPVPARSSAPRVPRARPVARRREQPVGHPARPHHAGAACRGGARRSSNCSPPRASRSTARTTARTSRMTAARAASRSRA